jgi:hypothetical protein
MENYSTLVVRNGKVIATIDFENETLIICAASQTEAEQVADGLMKPARSWKTETFGENSLMRVIMAEPCTHEHFKGLGYAASDMLAPDKILNAGKAQRAGFTAPTFEFQAVRYRQRG